MYRKVKFMLGKKDDVLREWFRLAREEERNISQIVYFALLYHVKTDEYLQLGKIHVPEEQTENARVAKNLTIPSIPEIEEWINNQKNLGVTETDLIRFVLLNGIEQIDSGESIIIPEPFLFKQVEKINAVRNAKPAAEPSHDTPDKKVAETSSDSKADKPEKKEVRKEKKKQDSIIKNLMPGAGFQLGED